MIDRPLVITAAHMSGEIVAFSRRTPAVAGPRAPIPGQESAFPQLVVPAGLIVPTTATVKSSLWVFRARKRILLKD